MPKPNIKEPQIRKSAIVTLFLSISFILLGGFLFLSSGLFAKILAITFLLWGGMGILYAANQLFQKS